LEDNSQSVVRRLGQTIEDLMDQAGQLVSIFVSSINTDRGNKRIGNKRDEDQ
jgi:hypothetical protein